MKEVRIWNYARSAEEIQSDKEDVYSSIPEGLIGYWRLNEGSGGAVADMASGHTGTLVGDPVWATEVVEDGGSVIARSFGQGYRYGYQGEFAEEDPETGWNHFELRDYDPVIGRWMTTDPAGQYWSPYKAMGNNPISGVDPDGAYAKKWMANIHAFFSGGTVEWADDRQEWFVGKEFAVEGGIGYQRSFDPGFDVKVNGEFSGSAKVGLLSYSDIGIYGNKIDILSAELASYKVSTSFSLFSGKSETNITEYSLFDNPQLNNFKISSGISAEIPIPQAGGVPLDLKYKQKGVLSLQNDKMHLSYHDYEAGVGTAFFEEKVGVGTSGNYGRIGAFEDVGYSAGPVGFTFSGFLGIRFE